MCRAVFRVRLSVDVHSRAGTATHVREVRVAADAPRRVVLRLAVAAQVQLLRGGPVAVAAVGDELGDAPRHVALDAVHHDLLAAEDLQRGDR